MLRRLLIWRVGIGYWLFAFLFIVPAFLFGSLANSLFGGDPLSLKDMKPAFGILPMFIIFFIVARLGQELGWTGFLVPRLQARFSAFTSCFIRAFLVGVWHLPLFLYARLQHPAITKAESRSKEPVYWLRMSQLYKRMILGDNYIYNQKQFMQKLINPVLNVDSKLPVHGGKSYEYYFNNKM